MGDTIVAIDSIAAFRAPISGFIADFLFGGYAQSCGLVLLGLHSDYDVPNEILLPASLSSSVVWTMTSPVIERIIACIGSKLTLLLASILSSMSLIALSWLPITSVSVLIFQGANLGISQGFGALIVFTVTAVCFDKRRGLATSLMKCGASAGPIIFPHVITFLLDHYGSRLTLFLVGGAFLNLLIPVTFIPSVIVNPSTGKHLSLKPTCACYKSSRGTDSTTDKRRKESQRKQSKLPVGLPLLIAVMFCLWMSMASSSVHLGMLPLFADELGHSKYVIATALSTRCGVDFAGRLVIGFLLDRLSMSGKVLALASTQLLMLVVTLLWLFVTSYPLQMLFVYVTVLGLCNSIMSTGWIIIVATFAGADYFSRAMSWSYMTSGSSLLIYALCFSAVVKALKSYRYLFFILCIIYMLSFISYVITAGFTRRSQKLASPEDSQPTAKEIELLNVERNDTLDEKM